MTKDEFLKLMQFPLEWNSWGMYPDELFQLHISGYRVGHEDASEHDRNGAFHWWLKRSPTHSQLERLLKLAVLDPDPLMGAEVRTHIRAAAAFDASLSKLESDLLSASEAEAFFSGVRDRECWSIIGGAGCGSVISLRFGGKVAAKQPLRNRTLSLEERLFEGERSLIIYCGWRLAGDRGILCGSQTMNERGDLDTDVLLSIKNTIVVNIGFASRWHDLRIEFERGIVLSVFCDQPLGDDADSNYVMFNPTTSIAVTTHGNLAVEKR